MITEEIIQSNKDYFIDLVRSIEREGMNTERLIAQLTNSDFFIAPASAMYHNAFKGGLCAHSLNVYKTLVDMCEAMYPDNTCPYDANTLKIVALFHDFDKMNKYECTVMNKKVYSESGTKYDQMGKYDWVSVPGYKRKDAADIFLLGSHGENSVYMTETFIPLTTEEHCAIINHHGVFDNPKLDVTPIFNRYSLACLLHLADMASTYIKEKI
jgi:hypothetical protein